MARDERIRTECSTLAFKDMLGDDSIERNMQWGETKRIRRLLDSKTNEDCQPEVVHPESLGLACCKLKLMRCNRNDE